MNCLSQRSLRSVRFLLLVAACSVAPAAQTPAPPQPATVFRSGTELVLVNVVVRDKNGAVVRGLTRADFSIAEDDKPQTVTSFDFEELDAPLKADDSAPPGQVKAILSPDRAATTDSPSAKSAAERRPTDAPAAKVDMHGRRLIVLSSTELDAA